MEQYQTGINSLSRIAVDSWKLKVWRGFFHNEITRNYLMSDFSKTIKKSEAPTIFRLSSSFNHNLIMSRNELITPSRINSSKYVPQWSLNFLPTSLAILYRLMDLTLVLMSLVMLFMIQKDFLLCNNVLRSTLLLNY